MQKERKNADATVAWPTRLNERQTAIWGLSSVGGIVNADIEGVSIEPGPAIETLDVVRDSSGALWPGSFKYHPWTGESLSAIAPITLVSGRYGSISGLPMLETGSRSLTIGPPSQEHIGTGSFYFCAGGTPGFLHAIDLKSGESFRKSRINGEWTKVGRFPRSNLPVWTNSVIGTREGIHYVTADALVQIGVSPAAEPTIVPLGKVAGAPAIAGRMLAVPYRIDGLLKVGFIAGGETKRADCDVDGAPSEIGLLATPISGAGDVTYWLEESGYLALEAQRSAFSATWHNWPENFAAKPFLHPFRSKVGDLWALGTCREEGMDRAAVCEILPVPGARTVHKLLGPHASAGHSTYRQDGRHQPPWEPAIENLNFGAAMSDRWPLPIVSLASGDTIIALIETASKMRAFLFREGPVEARSAKLYLHEPNGALHELGYACKLTSTDDLDVFAFEDRVYLYHRNQNECVSWRLV